jgi:predicted phosphodiesterase
MITLKGELAQEYISKHPKLPNLTLARMLFKDHPRVFKSLEDARGSVRYYRGSKGKQNREVRGLDKNQNPFHTLESQQEIREPYKIPLGQNKVLIISDIHIPYQDNDALWLAIKKGKEMGVNTVLINGDLMDLYQMSRFEKDPRKRNFEFEILQTKEFLSILRKQFPKAQIYFKKGNHDARYDTFMRLRAPELIGIMEFELDTILGLPSLKIHSIPDKQAVLLGKLYVYHGHEILRMAVTSVSPARTLFLKTKQSALVSHTHKISTYRATRADGQPVMCWSIGSLCELNPDYNPHGNDYAHGFAIVEVKKDGNFKVNNYQIIDGEVYSA